jgi:hypothetical protein
MSEEIKVAEVELDDRGFKIVRDDDEIVGYLNPKAEANEDGYLPIEDREGKRVGMSDPDMEDVLLNKEYEVQYSVKWVNFTRIVEAAYESQAIELAGKDLKDFDVTANNEEVSSLDDILDNCRWVRAESF